MTDLASHLGTARASIAAELESLEQRVVVVRRELQAAEGRQQRLRRLLNEIDHVDDPLELPLGGSAIVVPGPISVTAIGSPLPPRPTITLSPPPQTLREAAERVLTDAGRPLKIRELVAGIQARGLKADSEYEKVRASLVSLIHALIGKRDATFTKEGPGEYGLARWKKEAA